MMEESSDSERRGRSWRPNSARQQRARSKSSHRRRSRHRNRDAQSRQHRRPVPSHAPQSREEAEANEREWRAYMDARKKEKQQREEAKSTDEQPSTAARGSSSPPGAAASAASSRSTERQRGRSSTRGRERRQDQSAHGFRKSSPTPQREPSRHRSSRESTGTSRDHPHQSAAGSPDETSLATGRAPRRDATSLVRDHTSLLPARGETSLSMYLAVLHTLTSREPLQRIVLSRQVPSGEVLHDDARGMNPRHRVLPSLQAHRNLWSMGHHRHHNCRVNADHGIAMQRHARTATRTSLTSGATWSKNICPLVYNHT